MGHDPQTGQTAQNKEDNDTERDKNNKDYTLDTLKETNGHTFKLKELDHSNENEIRDDARDDKKIGIDNDQFNKKLEIDNDQFNKKLASDEKIQLKKLELEDKALNKVAEMNNKNSETFKSVMQPNSFSSSQSNPLPKTR